MFGSRCSSTNIGDDRDKKYPTRTGQATRISVGQAYASMIGFRETWSNVRPSLAFSYNKRLFLPIECFLTINTFPKGLFTRFMVAKVLFIWAKSVVLSRFNLPRTESWNPGMLDWTIPLCRRREGRASERARLSLSVISPSQPAIFNSLQTP